MLADSLGMSTIDRYRKIVLPGSVPVVLAGIRLSLTYALLGVIASEMIGSRDGLGTDIVRYSNTLQVGGVFAVLVDARTDQLRARPGARRLRAMGAADGSDRRASGRLQDEVVVVTGAARGLGAAIARAVADAGAHVLVGDLDGDGADRPGPSRSSSTTASPRAGIELDVTERSPRSTPRSRRCSTGAAG